MEKLVTLDAKIEWLEKFIERWDEDADPEKNDSKDQEALLVEWQEFLTLHDLPHISADELLLALSDCKPHAMKVCLTYQDCPPIEARCDEQGIINGDHSFVLQWKDFIFNDELTPSFQVTFHDRPECSATEMEG